MPDHSRLLRQSSQLKGYCCEIGFLEGNQGPGDSREQLARKLKVSPRLIGILRADVKNNTLTCPLGPNCCKILEHAKKQ